MLSGERSREGTQVLSGPACHLIAILGTLSDLGFSRNRCQESSTRGHLGGEPRKHLQGGDSEKGKDCSQPWWLLHLTLEQGSSTGWHPRGTGRES